MSKPIDLTAVVSDLTKVSAVMKLNNGTGEDGKVKTVNVSLSALDVDTYDDQKAMNIMNLMRPCLAKEVYEVQKVEVSILS